MQNVISFQERVCKTLIECSKIFQDTFLAYDYLVCSDAFSSTFRMITAHEGNYLHLTGVHTHLKAIDFFNKCIKQTLFITDFDFKKPGVSVRSVKGAVREKIAVLPYLANFFSRPILAMEGFKEKFKDYSPKKKTTLRMVLDLAVFGLSLSALIFILYFVVAFIVNFGK